MTVASDTPAGVSGYYARLGNVLVARGDTTEAVRAYRSALEIDAANEEAKHGLEIIRERAGKSKR
jgi:cytochrome c-type biogenesis protein CcmH/NrfG